MYSWTNACDCPDSYANSDLVVSRKNKNAGMQSYVWRMRDGESGAHSVTLYTGDVNTRAGTYYLNVASDCSSDCPESTLCTCSPCSNLEKNLFSLYVASSESYDKTLTSAEMLGTCPEPDPRYPFCSSSICSSTQSSASASSKDSLLSPGDAAGLAVAMTILFVVCCFLLWRYYCNVKFLKGPADDGYDDSQHLTSL